jgi:hypothetical protein
MICSQCKAQLLKSTIHEGAGMSTAANVQRFYDEAGVHHVHDPNAHSTSYMCSQGHSWVEKVYNKCACGWTAGPRSEDQGTKL